MNQSASVFGKLTAPIAIICICSLAVGAIAYAWNATSNTDEDGVDVNFEYVILTTDVSRSGEGVTVPVATTNDGDGNVVYSVAEDVNSAIATITVSVDEFHNVESIGALAVNISCSSTAFSYTYTVNGSDEVFELKTKNDITLESPVDITGATEENPVTIVTLTVYATLTAGDGIESGDLETSGVTVTASAYAEA